MMRISLLFILLLIHLIQTPIQADRILATSFTSLHHYAVGFTEDFQKLTGSNSQTNFKNDEEQVALLSVGFASLHHTPEDVTAIREESVGTKEFRVSGKALVYPNPFRQEVGAELGYKLTDNMDVDIHLYNMLGNLITKKRFHAGSAGGKIGYNRIKFNLETFDGYQLSAGVYFFVLIYEGSVLAKGKMAVIP